jgi:hypothetical protein
VAVRGPRGRIGSTEKISCQCRAVGGNTRDALFANLEAPHKRAVGAAPMYIFS